MKSWLKITIIVAVAVVISAVIVYFVAFKTDDKNNSDGKTRYKVTTSETGLNVRKDSNINSDSLGTLDKDSIVVVEKIENGFAYLPEYGGWASLDYLTKI